jgi:hypothetical protein
MTATLDVALHKSPMHSRKGLNLADHGNPLSSKEDVDISSSSSDPPDTSNTEWNHITKLGMHDVLLGRGGGTNNHEGNVLFRKLVNEHKMRYLACSKVDKPKVAREVVQLWRKMVPPGRFLARKDETKKGPGSVKDADNVWFEVGDKKAREKASQCLRERTAEVIPYMKQLREHQDAVTEHGVSMVPQQLQMHNNNNNQGLLEPDNNHSLSMNNMNNNHGMSMTMNNSNHGMNNSNHGMNNSNHGMNNSNHGMNPYSHPPGVAVAPTPAFPRRNSQPAPPEEQPYMGRRGSLPSTGQGHTSPYIPRRASIGVTSHGMMQGRPGGNGGSGVAVDEFFANTAPPLGGAGGMGGDEFYGDMTDMEYEQMMMLQRQHLQMQHMQIQRIRQQRLREGGAGARRPSTGGFTPGITPSMGNAMPPSRMTPGYDISPRSQNGGNGNHNMHAQGYQQQQQQELRSLLHQQQQQHHVHFSSQEQEPLSVQQDPLLVMANQTKSPSPVRTTHKPSADPRSTKRSVDESSDPHEDYQIGNVTPSPISQQRRVRGGNQKQHQDDQVDNPDTAPSSAAVFPGADATASPADVGDDDDCAPQDGELTLEEYRQQLEAYMSNNQIQNEPLDHPDDDDHLDSPSDLEDDWEKERDRAFKKEKKRGVGRNVSGVSFMSTRTHTTDKSAMGMSLVSGMSMFSADLMSMGTAARENKMNMTRSVGSNLSLMSELTDLSQNIDDLHLFDE